MVEISVNITFLA